MSIKTVLVHLAPDEFRNDRLKAAITICREQDAHLIALYVAMPVHIPTAVTGRGASAVFIAEAKRDAENLANSVRKTVEAECNDAGISFEWAYGDSDHLSDLLSHVHRSDLTILSQMSLEHFEDRLMFKLPEELIREAGGPVMVIPRGFHLKSLEHPRHVLVSWRYSKQAIRSLRDALPILHNATKVTVLTMDHKGSGKNPDRQILEYLSKHGIKAHSEHREDDSNVGEHILETAENIHADMIVMGAYGHSSLYETLIGGATRYVLGHSDIPVIMSH